MSATNRLAVDGRPSFVGSLSKPLRMLIYFLMFFAACAFFLFYFWSATAEANFY